MFGGFEGVETADALAEVLAGHVKELPADVIVQMAEAASRMWDTAREMFPYMKALRAFVTQILEIAAADGLLGAELAEFQAELVANVNQEDVR
jgi:DNA-binding ferritin-like protein (Dps family)